MSRGAGSELRKTVRSLRETIGRLRQRSSRISEDDTKRVLVNPLLSVLNWDLFDVEEVRSEYRHKPQDNPVDYALFLLRTPTLFVEAKALGKDLDERRWISQTIGYAATVGVEWCVLTNGDEYRIYNAHAALDAEEKLFRTARISQVDEEEGSLATMALLSKENVTEKLLDVLWKVEFVDKRVKVALDSLLSDRDESLVRLLRRKLKRLSPKEIRTSLGRARIEVDFPAATLPRRGGRVAKVRERASAARRTGGRSGNELKDLIDAGLLRVPALIEAAWKGHSFTAEITAAGEVSFDGNIYSSLSTAGGMARNQIAGPPKGGKKYWSTNGWTFWKYRDPETNRLRPLSELRDRALRPHTPGRSGGRR